MNSENTEAHLSVRLRKDIAVRKEEFDSGFDFILEDPVSGDFYRIGELEYLFALQLRPGITVEDLVEEWDEEITLDEASRIIRFLWQSKLLDIVDKEDGADEKESEAPATQEPNALGVLGGAFSFKIPLGSFDFVFARLESYFRIFINKTGFFISALILLTSGILVFSETDRLIRDFNGIMATNSWLWLGIVWIALKLIHESGHGIACKHYGGRIRSTGVMFILLTPLFYVDASESWKFHQRRDRIIVAAGGMYVEFIFAAICGILWYYSESGLFSYILLQTMFLSTFSTALFNANPLMRFDGYFILSELIAIPNLWTRGRKNWLQLLSKVFLGFGEPIWNNRKQRIVTTYGICSFVWQVIIMLSLCLVAGSLFKGAGILVAAVVFGMWLLKPMVKFIKFLFKIPIKLKIRFTVAVSLFVLIIGSILSIPIPDVRRVPGIVNFHDSKELHIECPGFVEEIFFKEGSAVEKGEVILRLVNPEQETVLNKLRISMERAENAYRIEVRDGNVRTQEIRKLAWDIAKSRYEEQLDYVRTLDLRAPLSGYLVFSNARHLEGRFFGTNEEVFKVATTDRLQVYAMLDEDMTPRRNMISSAVHQFRPNGDTTFYDFNITDMDAEAKQDLKFHSLGATHGGPITLITDSLTESKGRDFQEQRKYLTVKPFVETVGAFNDSNHLLSGQRGWCYIHSGHYKSLFTRIQNKWLEWADNIRSALDR